MPSLALVGLALASGCRTPEKRVDSLRAEDPPIKVPRALTVKAGSLPLATSFGIINGHLARPATPFESPYVLLLTDSVELEDEWLRETERISSAGYVVACLPAPEFEDPRDLALAWGEVLQRAVGYLEELPETDQRNGAVIGYGDSGARALQLSLVAPEIVSAVVWNPPPVAGGGVLSAEGVEWLIIGPSPEFDEEPFQDWLTLNGVSMKTVPMENIPLTFGKPTDRQSYYTLEADRARGIQSLFLLETIGSTDAPSLREVRTEQ